MNTRFRRTPNTAVEFVAFMEEVWRMDTHPAEDGKGVILAGSELYDEYYNARLSARRFGAARTGGTVLNGQVAHVYRFPSDGDRVAVIITPEGDGCKISYHGFSPKARKAKANAPENN